MAFCRAIAARYASTECFASTRRDHVLITNGCCCADTLGLSCAVTIDVCYAVRSCWDPDPDGYTSRYSHSIADRGWMLCRHRPQPQPSESGPGHQHAW